MILKIVQEHRDGRYSQKEYVFYNKVVPLWDEKEKRDQAYLIRKGKKKKAGCLLIVICNYFNPKNMYWASNVPATREVIFQWERGRPLVI